MVITMMGSGNWGKCTEKEYTNGKMDKNMKDSM